MTTYLTEIEYTCGRYSTFRAANGTKYTEATSVCQWDETWSWIRMDPCICESWHILSLQW